MSVYELTPTELYQAYAEGRDPREVLDEGRTVLATWLQVEQGMTQEEAFYAADEIRTHAQSLVQQRQREQHQEKKL